jgi:hypothetical protein
MHLAPGAVVAVVGREDLASLSGREKMKEEESISSSSNATGCSFPQAY